MTDNSIREAKKGEYPHLFGQAKFVYDDGELKGCVCISRVHGKTGMECWIHELEAEGKGIELMIKGLEVAAEWGFSEPWACVQDQRLAEVLARRGWEIMSVNLKKVNK